MRVEAFRTEKDLEKVKRRLKAHKDKRLYPMFIIGLNTGLRISDIVSLKVSDFRNKKYLIVKNEEKTNKRTSRRLTLFLFTIVHLALLRTQRVNRLQIRSLIGRI